jgi:small subunit ribosomal protein S6
MRTYETLFIVHPEVVGDDLVALIEKYRKVLTDQQAVVLKADNWGSRALAYSVKKQTRGSFVLTVFEGAPSTIAEFERRLRIDEKVIKYQTVIFEGSVAAAPVVEMPATEDVETVAAEAPADEAQPVAAEAPVDEA